MNCYTPRDLTLEVLYFQGLLPQECFTSRDSNPQRSCSALGKQTPAVLYLKGLTPKRFTSGNLTLNYRH